MVDELEYPRREQRQRRSVDGLAVRVVADAEELRVVGVVKVEPEVVPGEHPVEGGGGHLVQWDGR